MNLYSDDDVTAIKALLHAAIKPDFTGLPLDDAFRKVETAAADFVFSRHLPRETPSGTKRDLLKIAKLAERLVKEICASRVAQYRMNRAAARNGWPLVDEAITSVPMLQRMADQAGKSIKTAADMNRHPRDEAELAFLGDLLGVWLDVTGSFPPASRNSPFVDFVRAVCQPLDSLRDSVSITPTAAAIERFIGTFTTAFARNAEREIQENTQEQEARINDWLLRKP